MDKEDAVRKLFELEEQVGMRVARQEHDGDITHTEATTIFLSAVYDFLASSMGCLEALLVEHCHLYIKGYLAILEEEEK